MRPAGARAGTWVGCPGVLYDPVNGHFLLTYRERRPRGNPATERGWRCAIAESLDGVHFTDIWEVEKADLNTPSMERFCVLPTAEGYLLYLSYVDPADNRWRIDVVGAAEPSAFEVRNAVPALTAAGTGTEGVKDPYVMRIGPAVYLFASYAATETLSRDQWEAAHASADIYNTGLTTHPTGLATSLDGVEFQWHGEVLGVGSGWDRYQTRLNSVARIGESWVGFYDGSRDASENYEERCGLAVSFDLRQWTRLTPDGPWVTGRHGSGSVRYLDAVPVGDDELWVYYEYARSDGTHELRMNRLPL